MDSVQTQTLGPVRSHRPTSRGVVIDCGGPLVSVTVLTPRIVRVRFAPSGRFLPRRSWSDARADEDFPEAAFQLSEQGGALVVDTGVISVRVERETGRIAFTETKGNQFCSDEAAVRWDAGGLECVKRIEPGEHFYGFGERAGMLEKTGREMVNWTTDPPHNHGPGTDPMYIAIPVLLSLRPGLAYGVYFDNTWRSRFDMGRHVTGQWRFEAEGGEIDYTVFFGPTPAEVMRGIGEVLGTMPLPPRWALGYHQSRWGYQSDADIREVAGNFRLRGIPCDVIHFDIDYMHGYRVFTWHPERIPDPGRLLGDLRRDGFHAVPIIDPGVKVDPGYAVYREGIEHDLFIRRANGDVFQGFVWPDQSVFADFTRPEVREWWGNLQRAIVEPGAAGIWNDMNEPTVFDRSFSEGGLNAGTIDPDAPQGPADERTVHAEVHNVYGSGMARASYEGLRRLRPNARPFVLTRSGFAGIQRWSACWMGDNNSWWEHLELAMPQLMNMGLSGVPFVGTDIGGFHGNASGELFARWMQLGALSPFCRGHSAAGTDRHEPWVFGPRVESISRDFLRLRQRLMPYLYSLFWEASRTGAPVMRPLLYHYPDDPATYRLHDEFMLGPFLLAAPVYQPGREHRHVYLPEGMWHDWWTGERIQGPANLLAHAPLDRLPLYVRAGAILPTGPESQFANEHPLDPLTLHLHPGEGEFTLYEDDGETFDYEHGVWCTTAYRLRLAAGALALQIGPRSGAYVPPERKLVLHVHGVGGAAVRAHPEAQYDPEHRKLVLTFPDDGQARSFEFPMV